MNAALIQIEILPGGIPIRVARAKPKANVPVIRDPRAMNHMDPETKPMHCDLVIWGNEMNNKAENEPPTVTLLGRVMEQGAMGASQGGRPVSNVSERSAEVDALVAKLWGIGRRVLEAYYQRHMETDSIARDEHKSVSYIKENLRRSRWLLMSWDQKARKI